MVARAVQTAAAEETPELGIQHPQERSVLPLRGSKPPNLVFASMHLLLNQVKQPVQCNMEKPIKVGSVDQKTIVFLGHLLMNVSETQKPSAAIVTRM